MNKVECNFGVVVESLFLLKKRALLLLHTVTVTHIAIKKNCMIWTSYPELQLTML